ncbi:hypothetical protein RHOM_08150 [Roseburia hominis A2-183]|uniref:Uncharacterized protein n=1 Tax=Roseburia hominis (strain DSM 16839 / JCM 17582 / NCIMB 14029 / A2-183) TaxID=585394 RepID=G2T2W7_ROSHA|nr:hypothetical protein RHOM_08150 [Roseburia hominis A2-183]
MAAAAISAIMTMTAMIMEIFFFHGMIPSFV